MQLHLLRASNLKYFPNELTEAVRRVARLPLRVPPQPYVVALVGETLRLASPFGIANWKIEDFWALGLPQTFAGVTVYELDGSADGLAIYQKPVADPAALFREAPLPARPSFFVDPQMSFARLRALASEKAPPEWAVKPVSVEIELTHRCNLRCGGCAILADVERSHSGPDERELVATLTSLEGTSLYCYSLTGGEPFLRPELMRRLIAESTLDLFKIQTNAGVFSSPERAEQLLSSLVSVGYGTKAQRVKPSLNISVGMQTGAGVPLANAANLIHAHQRIVGMRGNLVLNVVARGAEAAAGVLGEIEALYQTRFGQELPWRQLQRVQHFDMLHTPRADKDVTATEVTTIKERIESLPDDFRCFNFDDATPSPVPRVLIRAGGELFPCSCFGFVGSPGSVRDTPVRELIQRLSNDTGYATVARDGLKGLLRKASQEHPQIAMRLLPSNASICKVCKTLREPKAPVYPEFERSQIR